MSSRNSNPEIEEGEKKRTSLSVRPFVFFISKGRIFLRHRSSGTVDSRAKRTHQFTDFHTRVRISATRSFYFNFLLKFSIVSDQCAVPHLLSCKCAQIQELFVRVLHKQYFTTCQPKKPLFSGDLWAEYRYTKHFDIGNRQKPTYYNLEWLLYYPYLC